MTSHIVSFSGGKDSTAMVLLALELTERHGFEPVVVFADTGHEHPLTYEYAETVERHTGLTIRRVKADFSKDMERKRRYIDTKWREEGIPDDVCDRAISLLQPTGSPFLDLCLWKGRFPSTRARFCSEELKHKPIWDQVFIPALRGGRRAVSWQGVRADESARRRTLPRWDRNDHPHLWNWRPILRWTVDDVFAMHRRHGLEPNPLYRMGMGRVGCMPCIHARKAEVAEIARRFPEEVERVAEWERLVSAASKRGVSTFFSTDKTPGAHTKNLSLPSPTVEQVAEWARFTGRDGRVYDFEAMLADQDGPATCSSLYGLCDGWTAPEDREAAE